jgi:hypothetical protein
VPTWLKLTIVVMVTMVLAGIIIFVSQIRQIGRFPEEIRKSTAEGAAFGRGKESNACVAEALSRATTRCTAYDQTCMPKVQWFLTSCLNTASEPEGFCTGVPEHKPFSFRDHWAADECTRRGYEGDKRCELVMTTVQFHCTAKKR